MASAGTSEPFALWSGPEFILRKPDRGRPQGHYRRAQTGPGSLDASASPDADSSQRPGPPWGPLARLPQGQGRAPPWASFGTFCRRHHSRAARGPRGPKRNWPDHSAPRCALGPPAPPKPLPRPAESRPGSAPAAVTRGQAQLFLVELTVAKCPSCSLRGKFWLWKITRPDTRTVPALGGQRRFLRPQPGRTGTHGVPVSSSIRATFLRSASQEGCVPDCPRGHRGASRPSVAGAGSRLCAQAHAASFWKARGLRSDSCVRRSPAAALALLR